MTDKNKSDYTVTPNGSGTHTTVKQGDRLLYSGPPDSATKFLKDHNKK